MRNFLTNPFAGKPAAAANAEVSDVLAEAIRVARSRPGPGVSTLAEKVLTHSSLRSGVSAKLGRQL